MRSDRIRLRLANNELCAHEVFKSAREVGSCTCQPERHVTVKFVKISLSQIGPVGSSKNVHAL